MEMDSETQQAVEKLTEKTPYQIQAEQEVAKAQEIRAKVQKVAKLFGMKCEPLGNNPEKEWMVRELLTAKTGEGFYVRADKYNKWKLEIGGEYPRTATGGYVRPHGYDEKAHEINVSCDKTPERIVQDIKRRFLPLYTERLAYVRKQIAGQNSYREQVVRNMEYLKGGPLTEDEKKGETLYLAETVRVYSDSVRFEYMSVPVEAAKKILAIIAESKGETES